MCERILCHHHRLYHRSLVSFAFTWTWLGPSPSHCQDICSHRLTMMTMIMLIMMMMMMSNVYHSIFLRARQRSSMLTGKLMRLSTLLLVGGIVSGCQGFLSLSKGFHFLRTFSLKWPNLGLELPLCWLHMHAYNRVLTF